MMYGGAVYLQEGSDVVEGPSIDSGNTLKGT